MARRQVLAQLDDELVAALDVAARRLGVSRSELLRRGAVAVLEAIDAADADAALQTSYRRRPSDPAVAEAAARLAASTGEPW